MTEQWTAGQGGITARQMQAFKLVFSEGLTYEQAGQRMGISKQRVAKLLVKIRDKYPDCIPKRIKATTVAYTQAFERFEEKAEQIKEKF